MIDNISVAIPVVFYVLLVICVSALLTTSFMDPGIIPRGIHSFRGDPNAESHYPKDTNNLPANYPFGDVKPWVYEQYSVRGVDVKTKFCPTCQLARPPRSSHCSTCDNCIDRFDHREPPSKPFSLSYRNGLSSSSSLLPSFFPPSRLSLGWELCWQEKSSFLHDLRHLLLPPHRPCPGNMHCGHGPLVQ